MAYIVVVYQPNGPDTYHGPFRGLEQAEAWARENGGNVHLLRWPEKGA